MPRPISLCTKRFPPPPAELWARLRDTILRDSLPSPAPSPPSLGDPSHSGRTWPCQSAANYLSPTHRRSRSLSCSFFSQRIKILSLYLQMHFFQILKNIVTFLVLDWGMVFFLNLFLCLQNILKESRFGYIKDY